MGDVTTLEKPVMMAIRLAAGVFCRGDRAMVDALVAGIMDRTGDQSLRSIALQFNVPYRTFHDSLHLFVARFRASWEAEGMGWEEFLGALDEER